MKKTQKIFAMLLCLVMLLSTLTGCTSQEAETPAETAAKAEETTKATAEGATEAAAEKATEAAAEKAAEEPVTVTIGIQQNPNVEDYDTNALTLLIEERTGVDLQFIYFANDDDEANSQLALMIAGGETLPDIIWGFEGIDKTTMYEYGEDGYFIDLNPYFEKGTTWFKDSYDMMSEANQQSLFALGTDPNNGALYGFPGYAEGSNSFNHHFAYINKDWLAAVGEEMPTTTDELYTVLKKFATEDPNGNGKADEIPAIVNVNGYFADALQFIINAWVYCDDSYFFNATDGKVWAPYNTDEYRQAMIYLNKLCSEGLLSPSSFTANHDEMKAAWTPADGTAIAGFIGGHEILDSSENSEVLFQYTGVIPFQANTELGGYVAHPEDDFRYCSFITSDCKNPDAAFSVLDFLSCVEGFLSQRYGQEGTDWEYISEGKSAQGLDARIRVINGDVYSSQTNQCWGKVETLALFDHYSEAWTDDGSWLAYRTQLNASQVINSRDAAVPDEVVHSLIYTAEENEIITEYATLLKDFVREQRALFVTGVKDPNNDADWESYLTDLESNGYSKYIETAQSAYTRMFN